MTDREIENLGRELMDPIDAAVRTSKMSARDAFVVLKEVRDQIEERLDCMRGEHGYDD